jgi:hypothetical protein
MLPNAALGIEHIRQLEVRNLANPHTREVREHDRGTIAIGVTPPSNRSKYAFEILIAQYPRPLPEDIVRVCHCGHNLAGS